VKLVVGLGNPGPRYADARHNIGFRIVDHLARAQEVVLDAARFHGRYGEGFVPLAPDAPAHADPCRLAFLEPMTFMNRSGRAIAAALAGLPEVEPAQDLLVVHDDLDLPLGRIRIRPRGGAGGHNGLADVISCLETEEFARLRFGIGRPEGPESNQGVIDFVLDGFHPEEQRLLADRIPTAADAAVMCLRDGPAAAMDRFNSFLAEGSSG
jgi:PTH1 family peptidyl-tRNA hydrolase